MKVIFLDIDNVLNCATSISNCYGWTGIDNTLVKKIARIVAGTGAKIVLTSTWKLDFHLEEGYKQTNREAQYMVNKFRQARLKIHDITIDKLYNRGSGIHKYLNEHPDINSWVVVDDFQFEDFDSEILARFVQTSPLTGITDNDMIKIIEILNKE